MECQNQGWTFKKQCGIWKRNREIETVTRKSQSRAETPELNAEFKKSASQTGRYRGKCIKYAEFRKSSGKWQSPGFFLDFCVEFRNVRTLSRIPRGNRDFHGEIAGSTQKRERIRRRSEIPQIMRKVHTRIPVYEQIAATAGKIRKLHLVPARYAYLLIAVANGTRMHAAAQRKQQNSGG